MHQVINLPCSLLSSKHLTVRCSLILSNIFSLLERITRGFAATAKLSSSHIFRFSPCSEISQSVISHHVTSKICLHRSTITTVHVFCSFISYVPASLQHFTSALKLTCRWLYAIVSLNNGGKKGKNRFSPVQVLRKHATSLFRLDM